MFRYQLRKHSYKAKYSLILFSKVKSYLANKEVTTWPAINELWNTKSFETLGNVVNEAGISAQEMGDAFSKIQCSLGCSSGSYAKVDEQIPEWIERKYYSDTQCLTNRVFVGRSFQIDIEGMLQLPSYDRDYPGHYIVSKKHAVKHTLVQINQTDFKHTYTLKFQREDEKITNNWYNNVVYSYINASICSR